MNQEQLGRLHEIDRLYEEGTGPLSETMLEIRKLMNWVFERDGRICCETGEFSGIRVPSNVKEMPPDIRVVFEKNWGIVIGCLKETDEAFRRAVSSRHAADWKAFRSALITWYSWGILPVNLFFTEFTWCFELVHGGVSGHRLDGKWSFLWSRERGLEWWDAGSVVN